MQFSRLISINTSVCPWTNVTVSSTEVFNTSSIISWLFCLRTLITVPRSLNFSILSNMKRRNNKNTDIDPDSFLDGPPQIEYKTQPIGRILDNLAIVFEATAFKAAFFSFFLFVNTSSKTDLSTLKTHSIPLSPPSGLVSCAWATRKRRLWGTRMNSRWLSCVVHSFIHTAIGCARLREEYILSTSQETVEVDTSREWQPTPQVEHQLQYLNSYLMARSV